MLRCRSSLGGVGAKCNFEQVRNGVGIEFFHDIGSVSLYRFDADTKVVGNLFVQASSHNAFEHLCLTGGELGH